ncbi:hypothetical protein [Mucilaginibacter myungsuensis]|uniref:Intein n=1 Tax=Mucilaginibacter myungsuensis TaxID=649104 RepID=A0A929KZG7_9SPHI|nr:hypothetical protein [Mucilaginibacter myungsuensis]MBE9662798.1 hypothetical protein [Mucilaginibacter myungsuensis]MDN3598218.1 hypothetical protein [Mucilaginibacter myungsuensis]
MKKYLVILGLMFCAVTSRAQTLAFGDMVDLVNLSVPQIELVLIQTGKFKINDKQEIYGQILNYYQTIDKNKTPIKGETMIVGAYRTTADGMKLKTITYNTIYEAFVENLMKQIVRFGYKQTFKGHDRVKRMFIFDNQLNHITVLFKNDHSLNSIIIRQKELGIEP